MGYVGEGMEDMLIQKAFDKLEKRGFSYPLNTCYFELLGILRRKGEEALDEYVATVKIK